MLLRALTVLFFSLFLVSLGSIEVNAEGINKKQLEKDIQVLSTRVTQEEKKASTMRREVRSLEKKLGDQTKRSYTLEKNIKKIGKRLEKTKLEKSELESQLKVQKKGLSQQLQALYSAGEQSHLRLLLKQDDPSDIGRTIKYFEYLNKSRIKKITRVTTTLSKLQKAEANITKDKNELHRLSADLSLEKKASKSTLKQRTIAYNKVKKNVNYKKRQLRVLKKKETALQAKIDRLIKKNNAKKQAQKKQLQQAQTRRQSNQVKSPKAVTNKKKQVTKQVGAKQKFTADRKFSTLRGKLSWPVRGRMIHAYAERRNEKQRWKGVVIATSGGRKVKAVAKGKVEFSGWFNGYGYLVIIRHDNNYRSLYGYNRAIYVRTGQIVKGGTTIAAVGNSGGQQQNALYFEIRKGSSPRNPAKWCR